MNLNFEMEGETESYRNISKQADIGQLLVACELMRIMSESFFFSIYRKH